MSSVIPIYERRYRCNLFLDRCLPPLPPRVKLLDVTIPRIDSQTCDFRILNVKSDFKTYHQLSLYLGNANITRLVEIAPEKDSQAFLLSGEIGKVLRVFACAIQTVNIHRISLERLDEILDKSYDNNPL